jgi:hypothetical protein
MNRDVLYDFCLDWRMESICRIELIRQFKDNGWQYANFEIKAKENNWYVTSMIAIKYCLLQY